MDGRRRGSKRATGEKIKMYLANVIMGIIWGILLHRGKLREVFAILLGLIILAVGIAPINPAIAIKAIIEPDWIIGTIFTWLGMACGAAASALYDSYRNEM